jgi:ABC-type antimicrobial peptide transport system permease subunit
LDIRLNDQQQAATGEAIYPQGEYTFEFSSSGSVSYYLGVGFWDDTYRDVWFYLVGTTNVTVGANTTITFENPTIAQMLTNFSGSRNWTGEYWDAYAGNSFCHLYLQQ